MTSPLLRHPFKPANLNTVLASSLIIEVTESVRDTANPKAVVVSGCLTGDVLYVLGAGDGGLGSGNHVTAVAVSTTGGSTGSWSTVTEQLTTGTGNACWIGAYTATVTADGDVTVSVNRTQAGTARTWRYWVNRVRNTNGVGSFATSYTLSNTQAVSIVADDGAAVLFHLAAWDIGLATGVPTPTRANVVENADDANYYDVSCYWIAETAGTRNYGTSVAGSSLIRCHAIELIPIGAGGGATNAPAENASLSVTAQDATVVTAVTVQADVAAVTVAAQDAVATTAVSAPADVAPIAVTANNATVIAVSNAPADVAIVTVVGQDATVATAVAVAADVAPLTVVALDATVSTSGATNAPADVAPLALAANDATVTASASPVAAEAPLAIAGMDASVSTAVAAQAVSAPVAVAAQDAVVTTAVSAPAGNALLAVAAQDATVLTGAVIAADVAAISMAAMDATVTVQQSATANADVAAIGFTAQGVTPTVGVSAQNVTFAIAAFDATVSISAVVLAECAVFTFTAEDVSNFQPYGSMTPLFGDSPTMFTTTPQGSSTEFDETTAPYMTTIPPRGSTMGAS